MIKVVNAEGKEMTIPKGAYSALKNSGWIKAKKEKVTTHEDTENTDEWDEVDEDVTKPISAMNDEELHEMAEKYEVDLSELTTLKQKREAIKKAVEKKG